MLLNGCHSKKKWFNVSVYPSELISKNIGYFQIVGKKRKHTQRAFRVGILT